ncbi:MAG TPA: TerC/Alx family metal homeostasis membrane protein [Ferruginibacter sp.]|nr:TerC/Alx family metal homeostasis membrane protein [Ferruginibacter sp.]
MDTTLLLYIVFSSVIVLALVFDLGLLSKKNQVISLKTALVQTIFWVLLSLAFCIFILYENDKGNGKEDAIAYISAYLLEWSLSIDNIFVFIIIFSYFKVKPEHYSRVLLLGILMAIIFRIIFIALGSELVARFDWVMYIFGVFLLYTGVKMFSSKEESEFDPAKSWSYRLIRKIMPVTDKEANGRFFLKMNNKRHLTTLSVVVIMLGLIDIVFAVDSIPAVFSIIPDPSKKLLIYSSNIFAVLGLRSLFFLLRGAATKFDYLQQGIAVVLVFIGLKMLIVKWIHLPVWVSLLVIVLCISFSIFYSIKFNRQGSMDVPDES